MDPTVLFLLRQQAKTELTLNTISERLDKLERKIRDIQNTVASGSLSKCSCRASDDSGGEYSRTTNGTTVDEDELISLLDQIAKYSQTIRDTQQTAAQQQLASLSSPPVHQQHHHRQHSQQQSPSSARLHHQKLHQKEQQQQQPSSQTQPRSGTESSSLSALLFEPNLSSVLANLLTSPPTRNRDMES